MRKLQSQSGETLVEALTAILIVALVMLFFTTSIAAASRLNRAVRDADVSFVYEDDGEPVTKTLTVSGGAERSEITVTEHTNNGFHYYVKTD